MEKCEICGRNKFEFLFDRKINQNKKVKFFRCTSCGIIFPVPKPTKKELDEHYSTGKYHALMEMDKASLKTKLKKIMYKTYFGKKSNFLKKAVFSPFKFMLRGTKIKADSKILDIGCGNGQFLYEMKQLGMETYGVEPSKSSEKEKTKEMLNIKRSELTDAKYSSNSFDVITMNHVFEHLSNPKETLREIKRLLKKEGLFIVVVPNSDSIAFKIFGKNWLGLFDVGHIINYSGGTLKHLLNKNGFKIIKTRYTSKPNQFAISLYIMLGLKRREGLIFKLVEIIFLPFTWATNLLKKGDEIEVWCTK